MKQKIKNLIFDVGGVIILTKKVDFSKFDKMFSLRAGTMEKIVRTCFSKKMTDKDFDEKSFFEENFAAQGIDNYGLNTFSGGQVVHIPLRRGLPAGDQLGDIALGVELAVENDHMQGRTADIKPRYYPENFILTFLLHRCCRPIRTRDTLS